MTRSRARTTLIVLAGQAVQGRAATRLTAPHTPAGAAERAPDAWPGCDAWFGPAADGGFWALGLAEPDPRLLLGVPMSTDTTGAIQRKRLLDARLTVRDLPQLRYVDTAADAHAVAAAAPHTRCAATLRRIAKAPVS